VLLVSLSHNQKPFLIGAWKPFNPLSYLNKIYLKKYEFRVCSCQITLLNKQYFNKNRRNMKKNNWQPKALLSTPFPKRWIVFCWFFGELSIYPFQTKF
jgi:hypothetical protein